MRKLLIVLFTFLISLGFSATKCPKDAQKSLVKIKKYCSANSDKFCELIPRSSNCEETISSLLNANSQRISLLQEELFKSESITDGLKEIEKELKSISRINSMVNSGKDKRELKKQLRAFRTTIDDVKKLDPSFLKQRQRNGMTNREIAFKLLQKDTKIKFAKAYINAREKYKALNKEHFSKNEFEELLKNELSTDTTLAKIIPFQKKEDRAIANVGLVIFSCEYNYNNHILLLGQSGCGQGEVKEWTFGPGIFHQYYDTASNDGSGGEGAAFICLSGDEKFSGVGVNTAVSAVLAPTIHVGAYVGTGVCIKAGMGLFTSVGAYAGISLLKIDSYGFNITDEMFNLW